MLELLTILLVAVALTLLPASGRAQRADANYDESKVPHYVLPDLLTTLDGRSVTNAEQWQKMRRPEIVDLLATYVYGKTPTYQPQVTYEIYDHTTDALDGKAIRKQVRVEFASGSYKHSMHMLMYLPRESRRVPIFLGLNFRGNHAVHPDPAIRIPDAWMRPGPGVVNNRATEAGRGIARSRWPVEKIIERGYGLATIYYGDLDPDYDDGFKNGVHPLFYEDGQRPDKPDEWGAIGAWAWGLSRALDYLITDPDVDDERVIVIGHSRLGKTALWAAAQDERFAMAISNNSGCGGAALSRRRFGETVAIITESFPHWFAGNFKAYANREDELPVDQHFLIAAIAPRPVYIASATEDLWADPRGEFLSGLAASPVWSLFGLKGLTVDDMPPVGESVGEYVGYHIRAGRHDITEYDWMYYLDFADRHLGRK